MLHRCKLPPCPALLVVGLLARRCCGQAESGSTLLGGGAPHGRGREAGLARHLAALVGPMLCSAPHHQPGASRRRLGGLSASSKSRPRRTTSSLQRRCRSCWRLLLRANVADLMLFSSCKRNTFSLHCLALRADQFSTSLFFYIKSLTHTDCWCQFSTGGFPILSRGGVSMHYASINSI